MFAFNEPSYAIRHAEASETGLISYLRLASLLCLEMPGLGLEASRALMSLLPDVSGGLVAGGRYFVADCGGELIGGGGWSQLPLNVRADCLTDAGGGSMILALAKDAVLVRGFFLDPDAGRRGAGAQVLDHIETDIAAAGHSCAEILVPASAQVYYRGLGFRPVSRLSLAVPRGEAVPMLQMRKCFFPKLAAAA